MFWSIKDDLQHERWTAGEVETCILKICSVRSPSPFLIYVKHIDIVQNFVLVDKNLIFAFKIPQQEQVEVFSWIMASSEHEQYDRIRANDVQMFQQDTYKEKE